MMRRWTVGILIGLAFAPGVAHAQTCGGPATKARAARVAAIVDPIVDRERRESGAPGAAFVFVENDCVIYARGYGLAGAGIAVDAEKTVWPIASISKVVTATAAMQLVGEGRVGLDADINRSLKRLRLPARGYGPATLRQLLSHTAGLDELPGRQFHGGTPPDLAAFLRPRLVRYRAPGHRTAYSSYGIALAGLLVEDVAAERYAELVRRRIFDPAGMTRARVMVRRGDEVGVATPYRLDDGRAEQAAHEWYVTTPTSSVVASAADMARFMRLHLGDGRIDRRRVLAAPFAVAMRTQQATVHPAVPGWGLGFQLDRVNGLSIAEHGGDIGGFSALMSLIPEKRAGLFIVSHGEGTDLRFKVKAALLDGLYPAARYPVPAAEPDRAPMLARVYAGRYLSSLACQTCATRDEDIFEVRAEPDGTLSVWGSRWIPAGRDLFVSEDGRRRLGFARDPSGRVDTMTGGSWRVANRLR